MVTFTSDLAKYLKTLTIIYDLDKHLKLFLQKIFEILV